AFGHFAQADGQLRSLGLHADLGARAHGGPHARDLVVRAIAAQDDRRLRSRSSSRTGRRRWCGRGSRGRTGHARKRSGPSGNIGKRKTGTPRGSAPEETESYAADITRADSGVPVWMNLAGVVRRDAIVLPVVKQDVG